MIAVFFLLSAAAAVPVNVQDGAVTPHWTSACGTTLLFSEDKKSWDSARGTCELFGGHLVDITSLQMNSCILSHWHQNRLTPYSYWHGGNDIKEEGVWRYVWRYNKYAGKWSDFGCNSYYYYICEK